MTYLDITATVFLNAWCDELRKYKIQGCRPCVTVKVKPDISDTTTPIPGLNSGFS